MAEETETEVEWPPEAEWPAVEWPVPDWSGFPVKWDWPESGYENTDSQ